MAPPVSPFYHALQLALMHPEREWPSSSIPSSPWRIWSRSTSYHATQDFGGVETWVCSCKKHDSIRLIYRSSLRLHCKKKRITEIACQVVLLFPCKVLRVPPVRSFAFLFVLFIECRCEGWKMRSLACVYIGDKILRAHV
jgi:hypothetical protein